MKKEIISYLFLTMMAMAAGFTIAHFTKEINYKYMYAESVKQTIKEMVKPESLKGN